MKLKLIQSLQMQIQYLKNMFFLLLQFMLWVCLSYVLTVLIFMLWFVGLLSQCVSWAAWKPLWEFSNRILWIHNQGRKPQPQRKYVYKEADTPHPLWLAKN